MYKWCRPNSLITAAFDVLDETRKMYLQYFICTASIGPAYFVHISPHHTCTCISKSVRLFCQSDQEPE